MADGIYLATAVRVYGTGLPTDTNFGTFGGVIKLAGLRFETSYGGSSTTAFYGNGTLTPTSGGASVRFSCSSSGPMTSAFGYTVTGTKTVNVTLATSTYTAVATYIARYLHDSELPLEKTLATLELQRLPTRVRRLLPTLCDGSFLDRGENLLVFGNPGRGKTHFVTAIAHALVRQGRRILFTPTYALVQKLLASKRDLRLERDLDALDRFDAVILDDLGYIQQSRDEMEVLFTFLAARSTALTLLLGLSALRSRGARRRKA